jgi:hypothetical protein
MKNKAVAKSFAIILTALLFTGCSKPDINSPLTNDSSTIVEGDQRQGSNEVIDDVLVDPNPSPVTSGNQGFTVNQIAFEVVDETTLSEQMLTEIETLKLSRGYYSWLQDDGSYLIFIGAGEKPTGGYTIEVTSMEDNEGKTNIFVKEAPPADNVRVMQVISYPYVIIKASQITDQFFVVDKDQVEYPALALEESSLDTTGNIGGTMLAGEENPLDLSSPIKGIYQGQIDNHSIEVLVGDLYVVLNADDIGKYLDGLEKDDNVEFTASVSPADQLMLDSIVEVK